MTPWALVDGVSVGCDGRGQGPEAGMLLQRIGGGPSPKGHPRTRVSRARGVCRASHLTSGLGDLSIL